jgi:hypothetical protein
MALATRDHRQIQAEARRQRNERARDRRSSPVVVLRVPMRGVLEVVAVSRSEPHRGYWLRAGADGRWVCDCRAFAYRGTCSHVEAASALYRPAAPAPVQGEAA